MLTNLDKAKIFCLTIRLFIYVANIQIIYYDEFWYCVFCRDTDGLNHLPGTRCKKNKGLIAAGLEINLGVIPVIMTGGSQNLPVTAEFVPVIVTP